MSKDGNIFFPTGIDMTKEIPTTPTDAEPEQPADYSSLEKVAKPKMTIWIESRCPFGTQAANGASYVKNLLGANANIELRYMVSKTATGVQAMHGEEELAEDKREICIREEQSDKFWTYMKCYAETGKPEDCEKSTKVDSTKLKDCVDKRSVTLLTKDANDWKTTYVPLGGSGSPSFFLNDKKINEYSFSSNGRSPENLKQILCNSMTTPMKACDTALPASNPPRGFGTIESGTAADVAQANC
jgi:hypothetical protein